MVGKLEDKVKMYKRLAENAEEMASNNLAKLRKAQVGCKKNIYLIYVYILLAGRRRGVKKKFQPARKRTREKQQQGIHLVIVPSWIEKFRHFIQSSFVSKKSDEYFDT